MQTEKTLSGYPSIDRPWVKYYSTDKLNVKPQELLYSKISMITTKIILRTWRYATSAKTFLMVNYLRIRISALSP